MKKFFSLNIFLIMLTTSLNAQIIPKTVSLRNDSTEISYIRSGKGATTLLFIHGWCINKGYWENQVTHFSSDYDVIAIDLPGFGQSTSERINRPIEEYAQDVMAFIDALRLNDVILIGHSMSGDIILEAALTNHSSIKGIIGIDNFKMVDVEFSPEEIREYMSFIQLMEKDYEKMVAAYADQFLFHPTTDSLVKANVKSDFVSANQEIAMSSLKELMKYGEKEPEKLEKLNFKLFLINSDAIPTNKEGLEKHCKSSFKVFDIHATGHYPMVEKPDEFNTILEEVLKEI